MHERHIDANEYDERLPMIEKIKFPRTRHIFNESGKTRDDLLLNDEEREKFLKLFNSGLGVITEKIDGFNIGIGYSNDGKLILRHRNHIVQDPNNILYKNAFSWAKNREDILYHLLQTDNILYIEWMEWAHSVPYDKLNDYAQVISLYDGTDNKFKSLKYINELFNDSGISVVPDLPFCQINNYRDCEKAMQKSNFAKTNKMEGLYLRVDDGDDNLLSAKFVDPHFISTVDSSEHWMNRITRGTAEKNKIDPIAQAKLFDRK